MHPWILDSLPQKMSKANIKVNNKEYIVNNKGGGELNFLI